MPIVHGDDVAGLLNGRKAPKSLDLIDRYVNATAPAVGLAVHLDRLGIQDVPGLQGYDLGLLLLLLLLVLGLVDSVAEQVDGELVQAELDFIADGTAEGPSGHVDEAGAQRVQGQEDRLKAEGTCQQVGAHLAQDAMLSSEVIIAAS